MSDVITKVTTPLYEGLSEPEAPVYPITATFWFSNRSVTGKVTQVRTDRSGASFFTVETRGATYFYVPATQCTDVRWS